jgi:hypothetical protein
MKLATQAQLPQSPSFSKFNKTHLTLTSTVSLALREGLSLPKI